MIFFLIILCSYKIPLYFCTEFHRGDFVNPGALVQLVRISACHAGGHGFESRTHRQQRKARTLSSRFSFLLERWAKVSEFYNAICVC